MESKDATCVGFLCVCANSHGTRDFASDVDLQAPFRNDCAIHRINDYLADKYLGNQLRYPLYWIEIYPVNSVVHLSNNWGHVYFMEIHSQILQNLMIISIRYPNLAHNCNFLSFLFINY